LELFVDGVVVFVVEDPGVVVDLIEVEAGKNLRYLFREGLKLYQATNIRNTASMPQTKSINCCHLLFLISFVRTVDSAMMTTIIITTANQ